MNFILFWLAYCVAKVLFFVGVVCVVVLVSIAYEAWCKMRQAWRRR